MGIGDGLIGFIIFVGAVALAVGLGIGLLL